MYGSGLASKRKMDYNAFLDVLERSDISYWRKGSYGAILICEIRGESPYVDSWNAKPITKILLKVGLESRHPEPVRILVDQANVANDKLTVMPTRNKAFISEVAIQAELYKKTERNPICPAIIDYFEMPLETYREYKLNSILQFLTDKPDLKVTVIGMEMVDDPTMVGSEQAPMGRAKLLEMGALGYVHGDFHRGNVLYSKADERVYLIDFGLTTKFRPDTFEVFKTALAAKNYTRALRLAMMETKYSNRIYDRVERLHKDQLTELRDSNWDTTPRNAELLRELNAATGNKVFENYLTHYGGLCAKKNGSLDGPQLLELSPAQESELERMVSSERIGPLAGHTMNYEFPEPEMIAATAERATAARAAKAAPVETPQTVILSTPSATPRSATPRSATPRSATPWAATPRAATPWAATPRAATPWAATPWAATPRAATPWAATPWAATPTSAQTLALDQNPIILFRKRKRAEGGTRRKRRTRRR
jgi:hypothetical protein